MMKLFPEEVNLHESLTAIMSGTTTRAGILTAITIIIVQNENVKSKWIAIQRNHQLLITSSKVTE